MRIRVLLALLVVRLHFARCQEFGLGGGPSTFGYDASSACSKPYSRDARAHFQDLLPCDFRQQNWCTIAGNAYPWHAVRKFVKENQGLMRRMYGDERHINVFKYEFEKNNIEIEYEDNYQPYPKNYRRFDFDEDVNYSRRYSGIPAVDAESREFTSKSLNQGNMKLNNKFLKLNEFTKPHFYSSESEKSTPVISNNTTLNPKTTNTQTERTTITTTTLNTTNTTTTTTTTTTITTTTTTTENFTPLDKLISALTNTTLKFTNSTSQDSIINGPEIQNNTRMKNISTTTPSVTLSDIARVQNLSINEIPGQIERFDSNVDESTQLPIVLDNKEKIIETDSTIKELSNLESIDRIDLMESANQSEYNDQIEAGSNQPQEFRPRPEYRPSEMKNNNSMQGQLYQDFAVKEKQKQSSSLPKGQGINACPVKEEVVAPFWANNTRGEVLALLNLYPFEQYVHWEKCTHENKQMYCRDGCKCEQQYRLHRLLAYDPNNECRGIFSDWFKFPSCCLCRCYNLPVEFRVTSRSPRRISEKKVKFRVTRN